MSETLFNFLLIFSRITAFITLVPGLSYKHSPVISKVVVSVGLTIVSLEVMTQGVPLPDSSLLIYFGLMREVLLGLAMGFIVQMLFLSIEMAGQFVDFQVGFSMGTVFDPALGIQASNYGRLFHWISLALFFALDFHHLIIGQLLDSFIAIPIGQAQLSNSTIEGIIKLFGESMKLALILALPLMIVALTVDVILGIISRSVSQINVLMLGLPLKILTTFAFMLFLIPNLVREIQKIFPIIVRYLAEFITSMS
ncbi:flagellar biosynthetic protein FliR [Vagococcus silagei]|uniref:Flagellar biosynthetic protein FliR n=1 Tax=Vagococcus silagei TaxID=2508885 RepID=A0A4S3B2P9_9ENTE|nr:flagellar biosynthetic protein FliR [Vagococcus silagei]THB61331.1 flagellar biosynthetic protein FliR [Vagococcus silagei]